MLDPRTMSIVFDLPLEIPKNEVTNAKDDPYPLFLIQIQFKYGNPLSITRTQVIINQ